MKKLVIAFVILAVVVAVARRFMAKPAPVSSGFDATKDVAYPNGVPVPEAPAKAKAPDAMLAVRPYLRNRLNDWDSYEDRGYSEPEDLGGGNWRVRHQFRAKNALGATVLNDWMFYYSGKTVTKAEDLGGR